MNWGFEDTKFYIEYSSCTRPVGNLYEEFDRRAVEIAEETHTELLLSISGGVDSQAMLRSFMKQDIPVKTVFMYLPGYNDIEYNNLKILDEKLKIKTEIVDIDPYKYKDELLEESEKYDIQTNSLLHKKFFSMLPSSSNIVFMDYDPYIHVDENWDFFWYQSLNSTEVTRDRALRLLKREGKIIWFGDTSEMRASLLNEEMLWSILYSWKYYYGNGVTRDSGHKLRLRTDDRWDFYLKPFIYGKYWKDELIYFSKFSGFENVPFLYLKPLYMKEHAVLVPLNEFVDFYNSCTKEKRRFYENLHVPGGYFD
jgi:hypothetical protein